MPLVAFLAYEGCFASSLSGAQDLLLFANSHWRQQKNSEGGQFRWCTVALERGAVTTASGLTLMPDHSIKDMPSPDIIFIPSFVYEGRGAFERKLTASHKLIKSIQFLYEKGYGLSTHCTGSFLLAEAGLLTGREATTSWWLAHHFKERYPHIPLKIDQLMIEHDGLTCGGSAGAEQMIIMNLIERSMGQTIASLCAKTLLLNVNQLEQTPYMTLQDQQGHNDTIVTAAQTWLQKNIQQKFSLEKLARHLSVSPRTLIRHFRTAIDDTPNSYLQKLRVDTAKKLLESTDKPVEHIMLQVGYEDISSFSRLFRRKTSLTPHAYRNRFKPKSREEGTA